MSLDDRTIALVTKVARQSALECCSYGGSDGERGRRGRPGLDGQQGAQGIPGATGSTGATGATGPAGAAGVAGAGAIIPFSGITTGVTSLVSSTLGFGLVSPVTITLGAITAGLPIELAAPRAGTITGLTGALFSNLAITGTTVVLTVYLNDVATALTVSLDTGGVISLGWNPNVSAAAIPVTTADRIALVMTSTGTFATASFSIAAGVAIS